MIVMKFGGTSVKDANAMKQVFEIIKSNSRKIVVLSACSGITDKLISISKDSIRNFNRSSELINEVQSYHHNLIDELIDDQTFREIAKLKVKVIIDDVKLLAEGINLLEELTNKTYDSIVSCGELLSTEVFTVYCLEQELNSKFISAREFIITNSDFTSAKVNFDSSKSRIHSLIRSNTNIKVLITQGFIGSDRLGNPTTLGRGGSDYSASVIGSLVEAESIEIYTDVNGILTADPKVISLTKTIKDMTFDEVAELSFYGAKVIHPDTISPAEQHNIPVLVKNTFNHNGDFTKIQSEPQTKRPQINSITMMDNLCKCTISFIDNNSLQTRINSLFKYIAKLELKVYYYQITSSGCIILIKNSKDFDSLSEDIFEFVKSVKFEENELIILCGNNLTSESLFLYISKITDVIKHNQISFISAGLNKNSILIGVYKNNSSEILNSLHKAIFG
jgi:aspartate kinase